MTWAIFHFLMLQKNCCQRGWDHERITMEVILSEEMADIWKEIDVQPEHVAKLAIGAKKSKAYMGVDLDIWQSILSEIIVGDVFRCR